MAPTELGPASSSQSHSHIPSHPLPRGSMAAPRPVRASERFPLPATNAAMPMPYMDARHRSPPSVEFSRHSPRGTTVRLPENADGPQIPSANDSMPPILSKISAANEQTWLAIGSAAESMEDYTRALSAYDSALLHNPYSVAALSAMATMYRTLDHFDLAVECFQRVLNITPDNGKVWGAMGHCYLMMDELQKAYTAYHQALYYLPNPKEPKLWYGIGILYDRYGSLEHAEETFTSVVRMDPNYEKANEIYFRLGIIYKQQGQYESSLECFRYILSNPPNPLTAMDIWFQIGHVYEQQEEYQQAKEAYERVLAENPNHAKVLQQLGGLYMQEASGFFNYETAIDLLSQSLDSDPNDQKAWYLLGRTYMNAEEYNKAYEAYQQTVYRDGKNPVLWCSIGILYFQISQFHDALGAYSRSIRLNPYIPEIWFNLGVLYESCNNQIADAIDAYRRVLELEPENSMVQQRLQQLQDGESSGKPVPGIPKPRDVHQSLFVPVPGPPGSPHAGDDSLNGAGTLRPPRDEPNSAANHPSMEESSSVAKSRQPWSISPRIADLDADGQNSSPRLPSYAATYADHRDRSDAGGASRGYMDRAHHARHHQGGTPHEWDRKYYGTSYEPLARLNPESSALGGSRMPSILHEYDAPHSRLHYDAARPQQMYASSLRSPETELPSTVHRGNESNVHREGNRYESSSSEPIRGRPTTAELSRMHETLDSRSPRANPSSIESVSGKSSVSNARPSKLERRPEPSVAPPDPRVREVDEDYDEGAASALMGLAGAAASAYEASNAERQRQSEAATSAIKHPMEGNEPSQAVKRPRNEMSSLKDSESSPVHTAPTSPHRSRSSQTNPSTSPIKRSLPRSQGPCASELTPERP
ncbi:glucose repression mediator protein [Malassezia yamatoensis]|uniref:Glucose repression mediator protein n=1 Tax=Malassezia yamatoensis TaxID=253288 RepID=A0AAJ6CFW6_9BASI|nr:glucose repression mediator protein [Malassezia yamatoensis]